MEFQQLGVTPEYCSRLNSRGMTLPTEVQQHSIPMLLKGKDLIVQAQTGTGKTLSYLLPVLQMLDMEINAPQVLILVPTRELALQITMETKKIISNENTIRVACIVGGQDIHKEFVQFRRGVHIVIGTPGRLLDHLKRGTIPLDHIHKLVLDEADQMLHMGFLNEVEVLIEALPANRQTMLFSATMPNQIRRLARSYMNLSEDIQTTSSVAIPIDHIEQRVVECTTPTKHHVLDYMLKQYRPYLAIVFCRTKRGAIELNNQLYALGYASDELHGDLPQAKRERVMKAFRTAKLQVLVATDIAARGLDVEGVTHVFNYDLPCDAESYIHRIGRTGRAGEQGVAITLVTPKENAHLMNIEKLIGQKLHRDNWTGMSLEKAVLLPQTNLKRVKIVNKRSCMVSSQKEQKKRDSRYGIKRSRNGAGPTQKTKGRSDGAFTQKRSSVNKKR